MANENLLNMAEQKFQSAAEKIAKDLIATCYKEPQTKADRIRAMTDEELSAFLWEFDKEETARTTEYALERRKITEWLKQPAE